MKYYDLEQAREFWEIIKPTSTNSFVEIRLTPTINKSREFWENCNELKRVLSLTPTNKTVCFFINSFNELKTILEFKGGWFNINCKMCYGIQERERDKDGNLNGSYDCINNYRFFFLDIDSGVIDGFTKELFDDFLNYIINYLSTKHLLFSPTIVDSGGGHHLIYKIEKTNVTENRKVFLKKFTKDLCENIFIHDLFKVDSLSDAPRVAGLPGSWNVKRNRPIKIVKNSDFVNKFKFKKIKINKIEVNIDSSKLPEINSSLEFKILSKPDVPEGDRQMYLIFQLKCLLRDKKTDYKIIENELRPIYNNIDLNYNKGIDGKSYNPRVVISWCNKNMDWLKKYDDLLQLYKKTIEKFIY